MAGSYIDYHDGGTVCEAYVALPDDIPNAPAILVVHQWAGQGEQERETADRMAALGYAGIAIDVYGKGARGDPAADNSALLGPWFGDRAGLLRRLTAAVDFAKGLDGVDAARIGMVGYCFGGLCVLDVARGQVPDVLGVVSLHGVFAPPQLGEQGPISAKILVCHGYDDPMADPQSMLGLADELTAAKADWQIHAYGHTTHAFTRKTANEPEKGMNYSPDADQRSWHTTVEFFDKVFA